MNFLILFHCVAIFGAFIGVKTKKSRIDFVVSDILITLAIH